MNVLLFVFAAALGGVGRYIVETRMPPTGSRGFPTATLLVNVVGSFLLGLTIHASHTSQLVVGTAFCGALTTFSGVSLQLHRRIAAQDLRAAIGYLAILVGTGLSAAWLGIEISARVFN